MLKRVLEDEVMDTVDEAVDYNTMDHSAVNLAFVADLFAAGADTREVLDLGTGTGLIPVELCQQDEQARVVGVDLAVTMLDIARINVDMAGLTHQIMFDLVDAKELPFETGRFSTVMSNSIIHHIPRPAGVLAEVVRVTAPGGLLFFRDLLRPDDEPALARLVETYAGDANEHQRKMFSDSLHAALTVEEMQALVAPLGFDPQTVLPTSDRHWTFIARKGEH